MLFYVDKTMMMLVKLVTYRSFCKDTYQSVTTIITWNSWQTHTHFANDAKNPIKYYNPSITTYVRHWVCQCEICNQSECVNNSRITPGLIHIPEWDLGPQDFMQIDLLPELPPSGGYENIIRGTDVLFGYAFAYPVFNSTPVNTAETFIDMKRHASLPTLIIRDKRSVFVSKVIHEVAEKLCICLKHVLPFNNTTYLSSIDCEPGRVFLVRIPHKILDHKLRLRFNPDIAPATDFVDKRLRKTKILHDKSKKNVMQSYIK